MHSRSIEFAKKYGIRVIVRSSMNYEEGTVIKSKEEMMEKHLITGVTSKTDQAKITVRDIPDKPGIAQGLFNKLAEKKVYVDMIVQSTGKDNHATISFTVLRKDIAAVKELCEQFRKEWNACEVSTKEDIAIVSAVGVGMMSSYGVAGRMFGVLAHHGVNIEMIATSEIGISCVIDEMYAELAVKAIHKEFVENAQ
jgi:aspartate kinase